MSSLNVKQEALEEPNVETCHPGGSLIYGRVSADVETAIRKGSKVKGLRIWYRCNSCRRSIRLEEEANHNREFHTIAQCKACGLKIDKFLLSHHERVTCPKLTTFCQYCSTDCSLGDIHRHYDECSGAKEANMRGMYPPVLPLQNIVLSDSKAQDLVNIGETMAKMTSADKFPVKRLDSYKGPFGYQLYLTETDSKMAGDAKNEKLEQRQLEQLQRQKQLVCDYLNKKLSPPQDKIKRLLQTYALNVEAEAKLMNVPKPTVEANPKQKLTSKVTHTKKYTRVIHDFTASLCRQDVRRQDDVRQRHDMHRNLIRLNRRHMRNSLKEDRQFVINDAIRLEQQKYQVEKIPKSDWPDFIQNLKSERPVWPDLGLNLADSRDKSADFEDTHAQMDKLKHNLRLRKSMAMLRGINNPETK